MTKASQISHPQFNLDRIITGKFNYFLPAKKPGDFDLNFHIVPKFSYNLDQNKLQIKVLITGHIKETDEEVVSIETLFIYSVNDLSKIVTIKNSGVVFEEHSQPFLASCLGISISTLRGILHTKLLGTLYADKLIPVVNPNTFFKKNVKVTDHKSKIAPSLTKRLKNSTK